MGLLAIGSWQRLPDLPSPISGQMAGVSGDVLLVIGGSNFPVPLFEGGTKTWVDTVFALEPGAPVWKTARLPMKIAYGGSVTTDDGVIVIGGGDAKQNFRHVQRLNWTGGTVRIDRLPDLPRPLANLAAARLGNTIYACGGQESPTATMASRSLAALDLANIGAGWRLLEEAPGPGRILPAFAAHGASLYLFSGAELFADEKGLPKRRYLSDAWRYTPGKGWHALPPMPRPAVAAPAISTASRILIFGGDDGENALRIQELKDKHPGFRRDILAFDPASGKWSESGTLPIGLVTTAPAIWQGKLVIPGGEDRPGHRSGAVLSIALEQLR
jgi:N-acetylneuraminate epimerase